MERERLECLVDNALHTKRFALYVGRCCRSSALKDVAAELNLDWHTVKRLQMDYMREQIRRVGTRGLPIPVRLLLAAQPKLTTPVLLVVHRVITGCLLDQASRKAGQADSGAPSSARSV